MNTVIFARNQLTHGTGEPISRYVRFVPKYIKWQNFRSVPPTTGQRLRRNTLLMDNPYINQLLPNGSNTMKEQTKKPIFTVGDLEQFTSETMECVVVNGVEHYILTSPTGMTMINAEALDKALSEVVKNNK